MVTKPKYPTETVKHCQLCGASITFYYAMDTDRNSFCCTAHKNEWHSLFPLSVSRLNALEAVRDAPSYLPYTDTVIRMSGKLGRTVPLVNLVSEDKQGKKYEITELGKKVLDKHYET